MHEENAGQGAMQQRPTPSLKGFTFKDTKEANDEAACVKYQPLCNDSGGGGDHQPTRWRHTQGICLVVVSLRTHSLGDLIEAVNTTCRFSLYACPLSYAPDSYIQLSTQLLLLDVQFAPQT